MKYLSLLFFTFLTQHTMAQQKETFMYRLELIEVYKTKRLWSEKEHQIQKEHVAYLDSLTRSKKIIIGGIVEQNLQNHTGLVILNVENYKEALGIVQNDPSVKEGMMVADIERFNLYFLQTE